MQRVSLFQSVEASLSRVVRVDPTSLPLESCGKRGVLGDSAEGSPARRWVDETTVFNATAQCSVVFDWRVFFLGLCSTRCCQYILVFL